MKQKKKAGFLAYAATPLMAIMGTIIASLVSIYILKLKGENSPVPIFVFFGIVNLICMSLYAILPKRGKSIARYSAMFIVGSILLFLAGLLAKQNLQVEGFFFFIFAGAFGGVIVHYFVGKIIGPLIHGRTWCGWGCWTTMILDLLPYKESKGWSTGKSKFKYIYFILALATVFILMFGFDYTMHESTNISNTTRAFYWFLIGNVLYYGVGIILAIVMKDNRAFCKYLCPASVFLKTSSTFSLLRIKGDKDKCTNCGDCTTSCLMSIDIPKYTNTGQRVKSSECIMCMKCIATCPEGALKSSVGFDVAFKNNLNKY